MKLRSDKSGRTQETLQTFSENVLSIDHTQYFNDTCAQKVMKKSVAKGSRKDTNNL